MKTKWIHLIFLISLVLGSCAPAQGSGENEDLAPLEPIAPPSTNTPQTSSGNPLPVPTQQEFPDAASVPAEKYIDLAKLDLANLLQVDVEQISLVNVMEMTWPDAALGCPAPGKVYAQGKVPGYQIRLGVEGVEYIYHADLNGQIIQCPQISLEGNSPLPADTGPTPQIGVPID